MKTRIILFLLLFSWVFSFAQNANIDNGFMVKGYDVVACLSGEAIEGCCGYVTEHKGLNYEFSSEENMLTFQA